MEKTLQKSGLALITFFIMEFVAWSLHKYVMHGMLWILHKSHHQPRRKGLELNDFFGVFFALLSMGLFFQGSKQKNFWSTPVGIGMTMYGMAYFLVHDIIIHKRISYRHRFNSNYIKTITKAHRAHHSHLGKENGEAFGFLWADKRYAPSKN